MVNVVKILYRPIEISPDGTMVITLGNFSDLTAQFSTVFIETSQLDTIATNISSEAIYMAGFYSALKASSMSPQTHTFAHFFEVGTKTGGEVVNFQSDLHKILTQVPQFIVNATYNFERLAKGNQEIEAITRASLIHRYFYLYIPGYEEWLRHTMQKNLLNVVCNMMEKDVTQLIAKGTLVNQRTDQRIGDERWIFGVL